MGIVEGLVIWVGVSILFCLAIGRMLHRIEPVEADPGERNFREPVAKLVVMRPSGAHR